MKFVIRGQHLEVTESLREYAEKKIGKLERYFEAPLTSEVNVTMSVVKNLQSVEVTIPLPGVLLRAEVRSDDMYASIDLVVEKLERQIRKHKTKINRRYRKEGARGLFRDFPDTGAVATLPDEEEEDEYALVRTKRFNLKPMDVDEAILQMNMLGHNFFVFANIETNEVNVVYKRSDGKYGLIEPQR
ncbi:ribosome hibernation-promoting factor, HPF/YfiA family [Paenibacillus thermoaerophilus]|uniref:Ribosome hibernation promoting factor n=1 Tax=Paenibacillus thermoaerophilus TaxID=1215385 RepID=A0ABW2V5N3_9BACL|nr:ribosome-associated translation inhibitor RaiA [Paenibacillus thermoaerophilus]TMV09213.1 ribosome-associated translation inhibitor RaiA [Paenibacillus thermoaerophilus]